MFIWVVKNVFTFNSKSVVPIYDIQYVFKMLGSPITDKMIDVRLPNYLGPLRTIPNFYICKLCKINEDIFMYKRRNFEFEKIKVTTERQICEIFFTSDIDMHISEMYWNGVKYSELKEAMINDSDTLKPLICKMIEYYTDNSSFIKKQ